MYSVIIPTLNEGPNLWFTIHCLKIIWDWRPDEHELIVVDNGSTDNTVSFLQDPVLGKFVRLVETDAPGAGSARQVGAGVASGDVLFFLDAHVLVPPTFFSKALSTMRQPEIWERMGAMHFPIGWNGGPGDALATHYRLTLDSNFWGDHVVGNFEDVTEIASAGHAAVAVRRDHFESVRGYHAPFVEYGGEETYLDLKLARFGYRNYVCPSTYILHCSQRRQMYHWSNDTLFRNQVVAAYTVGGEHWAQKLLDGHLVKQGWNPDIVRRLYAKAIETAKEDHDFIQANALYTLEQVLLGFKERGVPH